MKKNLLTFSLSLFAAAHMFALPPLLGDTSFKASSVDNLDFNMSWENLQIKKVQAIQLQLKSIATKKSMPQRLGFQVLHLLLIQFQ